MRTVYEFSVKDRKGKDVSLKEYANEVLLIVNTASKCGFTPQYQQLQDLYETYKDRGLEILGFPSNQFMNQEPGDEKSIEEFCSVNYGVTFPMFSKVNVKGDQIHPLFRHLTNKAKMLEVHDYLQQFRKKLLVLLLEICILHLRLQ